MIETVNIWRREVDGRVSICILMRLDKDNEFKRYKYTVDTFREAANKLLQIICKGVTDYVRSNL